MIVSYEHNYIFVKTAKTAGTSMEIALSTFTGEKDIITPIYPLDELKRAENPAARLPQNFCGFPKIEQQYREIIGSGKAERIERFHQKHFEKFVMFRNHTTVAEIRFFLAPEFFRKAFKFTIQRHPYDRMLSLAYFRGHQRKRSHSDQRVQRNIRSILRKRELPNSRFFTIEGETAVDFLSAMRTCARMLRGWRRRSALAICLARCRKPSISTERTAGHQKTYSRSARKDKFADSAKRNLRRSAMNPRQSCADV